MKMPLPKRNVNFDDIRKIVTYINRVITNNGILYIHCDSGIGRSPLIVMCYLMLYHNYNADTAEDFLLRNIELPLFKAF